MELSREILEFTSLTSENQQPESDDKSQTNKKTKRKKQGTGIVSFEEIDCYDFGHGRPYLNSPRSIEICRQNGITVNDLIVQPRASFRKSVADSDVLVKTREERGEINRRRLLRTLRGNRDRMIATENSAKRGQSKGQGGKPQAPTKSAEEVLMEREAKYLEKVQNKTQKELQQLLSYEIKRFAAEEDQNARMQRQNDADLKRKMDRKQASKEAAEKQVSEPRAKRRASNN